MPPLENTSTVLRTTFTAEEVEKHSAAKDLWVSVDGVVYDVTEFAEGHPGGMHLLLEHGGKDVSLLMRSAATHDHSESAFDMLQEYRVGVLANYDGVPGARFDKSGLRKRNSAALQKGVDDFGEALPEVQQNSELFDSSGAYLDLIDMDGPIVDQLWNKNMSLKEYLVFTHTPRYMRGGRIARFFKNDFLEFNSRNNWWSVLVWIPIWMTFFVYGSQGHSDLYSYGAFALGIFNWTFLEYTLHRFLFHMDGLLPENRVAISLHFLLHGVHHFLPMDRMRLVFPPLLGAIIATPLYYIYGLVLPTDFLRLLFSGTLCGFMCYDLCHYYLHHGVPATAYLRDLKSYHMNHHYKDYHLGYGITSKFWDYVFATVL